MAFILFCILVSLSNNGSQPEKPAPAKLAEGEAEAIHVVSCDLHCPRGENGRVEAVNWEYQHEFKFRIMYSGPYSFNYYIQIEYGNEKLLQEQRIPRWVVQY